jgi:DNA mismatch repair protein MutS2
MRTFQLLEDQKAKSVDATKEKTKDGSPLESKESPRFKVGDKVRVPKWKAIGEVLRIEKDQVKVAMGNLQVMLGIKDIEPLTTAQRKELGLGFGGKLWTSALSDSLNRPAPPPSQIDLRGLRLDEAMRKLEPYLDLAYRSGSLREVNIIHGVGTGAIREKTRDLLKSLPYVKAFRDGGIGGGGPGATIVEFDL